MQTAKRNVIEITGIRTAVKTSGLLGSGEAFDQGSGDAGGFCGLAVDHAPDGPAVREELVAAADLCEAFARDGGPFDDPGRGGDVLVEVGRLFVIDLVSDDYPRISRLRLSIRRVAPVSDRDVLDPTKIGHVVDVALFVNVGRFDGERMREFHCRFNSPPGKEGWPKAGVVVLSHPERPGP